MHLVLDWSPLLHASSQISKHTIAAPQALDLGMDLIKIVQSSNPSPSSELWDLLAWGPTNTVWETSVHLTIISKNVVCLVWGNIQHFSGLTSVSVHRDHFWQCSGSHMLCCDWMSSTLSAVSSLWTRIFSKKKVWFCFITEWKYQFWSD